MGTQALELYQKPLTAVEIRAHVNLIQEVMRAVMKENTHYGVIPGCKKPSLWKPGAEVLFTTFRISVDPIVEDLSTHDEARFRVTARAVSFTGTSLGSAVGEASSNEEKYMWREQVCQEEFDSVPETERRFKWKQGRSGPYCIQQVRTNIADHRNTVLKMAAKRAAVALALQVTAASDIFTQDIEDLPDEYRAAMAESDDPRPTQEELPTDIKRKSETHQPVQQAPKPQPVAAKPAPVIQSPRPAQPVQNGGGGLISDAQGRRLYAIWKGAGRTQQEVKQYLSSQYGIDDDHQIPRTKYEEICEWAGAR